ncbi:MAG: pseudouridine synthase [Candidatus Peribacteraceae bacterium]|nr:pseudouridine synthase [Candidatus Peribacteraceae bacterium]
MQERLQKILSVRGIASRRKAEEYIVAGLVKVNGIPATLGQKADPEKDQIEVDGKVLAARREMLYYLMNKPVGVVSSNIERLREKSTLVDKTVRDLLPTELQGKIFPVGRLDKESEGLLLLTNDGVLAYRLTHPKFDHEKEYAVTVEHPVTEGALQKMRNGMTILGEKTKPTLARKTGERSFAIALTEGKNRQIRRMCQKVGNPVISLRRIRIMTLKDTVLKSGQIRPLTATEKTQLLDAIGI